MGFWANSMITLFFATENGQEYIKKLPAEIQIALVSDFMSVIGDLFKKAGLEAIISLPRVHQTLSYGPPRLRRTRVQ